MSSAPGAAPTGANGQGGSRARQRRALREALNRNAERMVRRSEPLFLGIVLASEIGLIAARVVAATTLPLAAMLATALALLAALHEHYRSHHRHETLGRLVRVVVVALGAPAYAFQVPIPGWPWLWLLGMAALYPAALGRRATLAFVIGLTVYEEAVALRLMPVPSPSEIVARTVAFVAIGLLSHAFGQALNAAVRAQRGMRLRDQRAQVVAAHSDVVMVFADRSYRLTHVNSAVERCLGYPVKELRRIWGLALLHPDERVPFLRERRKLLVRDGTSTLLRLRVRHASGRWVWFETRITNLLAHPAVGGFFVSATDITARVLAEQQLRNERTLLRTVVDYLPLSVYTKNREGRYLMSNRANLVRLGRDSERDVIGRRATDLALPAATLRLDLADDAVLESGNQVVDQELHTLGRDGSLRWYQATKIPLADAAGNITGLVGMARDITEHRSLQAYLVHQATHDVLTGLYNRRYFTERLAELMQEPRPQETVALLFCDLDLFKSINDRYGHEMGDEFLRGLGARLANFGGLPPSVLARFGGDEFVLLAHLAHPDEALRLAERMLDAVRRPIALQDLVLQGDASIGVATLRADHRRPEDLIRDADTAMYQAKTHGRNRVAFFDGVLRERAIRQAGLAHALRGALERDELSLIYQPKISLKSGRVSGFEALMRWHSPEFGAVSPQEFIPLAEESGLIVPFGSWALERACLQLRDWQVRYPRLDHLSISVNVSMRQLLEERFLGDVVRVIETSEIYPAALELELTETAAMLNPDRSVSLLRQLKERGLRLALDDFGTGYSSLAYLRRLPVDVLKIDRAFVHGLESTRDDGEIVRLVLALTQAMGIESVAEGIESQANAAEIKRLGCDLGQGFYFSRALPAAEAANLLARNPEYAVA